MAKLYYRLIKEGRWTIEQVPTRWKATVEKLLDADKESTDAAESESV